MELQTNANLNVTANRCHRASMPQRGYALLMLMFFVALMLIAVSAAGPRILQEGKRDKEQEMVWRGKQYIRGVKLYYKKTGRFPRELDDLTKPKLGSLRFMRQAYKDPMNGEDGSWRLLYVGPAGQIIGSLKPPEMLQLGAAGAGLGASASSVASASTGQSQSAFGSSSSGSGSGFGNSSFGNSGGSSFGGGSSSFGNSNSSSGFGGNSSSAFGNSSFNNSTNGQQQQQQGQPGAQQNGQGPGTVQAGGTNPDGSPVNPNSVGDAAAANGGTPDQQGIASSDSTIIGGNIIGVGSKKVAPSLMVYEKAKNYHLFEFVWDPSKDTTLAGAPLQTGPGLGQGIGGTGIGTGNGSAFGSGGLNNSNGSNSSFGNSSFGSGSNTNNAAPGAGAPNPNPNPEPPTQAPPNPPPDQQQQ